jgi:hypothetical protein
MQCAVSCGWVIVPLFFKNTANGMYTTILNATLLCYSTTTNIITGFSKTSVKNTSQRPVSKLNREQWPPKYEAGPTVSPKLALWMIHCRIQVVYGEDCVDVSTVHHWAKICKDGKLGSVNLCDKQWQWMTCDSNQWVSSQEERWWID